MQIPPQQQKQQQLVEEESPPVKDPRHHQHHHRMKDTAKTHPRNSDDPFAESMTRTSAPKDAKMIHRIHRHLRATCPCLKTYLVNEDESKLLLQK